MLLGDYPTAGAVARLDLGSGQTGLLAPNNDIGPLAAVGHQHPWVITTPTTPGGKGDVLRVHIETGEVQALVASPSAEGDGWLRGDTLFFARGRFGDEEDGSLELWMRRITVGEEIRLTDNDWNDYELALSPDGSHLCWQSEQKGHFSADIRAMDISTGKAWDVSSTPMRASGCRWTQDGSALIYTLTDNGETTMILQPIAGGDPIPISPFQGFDRPIGFLSTAEGR